MHILMVCLDILSSIVCMIFQILSIKYLFCRDLHFNKNSWFIIIPIILASATALEFYASGFLLFFNFILFPVIVIIILSQDKRLRKTLYVIPSIIIVTLPIILILLGIAAFVDMPIYDLLKKDQAMIIMSYLYCVIGLSGCYVLLKRVKYIQYNIILKKWEKLAFYSTYILSICALFLVDEIQKNSMFNDHDNHFFIFAIAIIVIILNVAIIFSIVKSKSANYYKYLTTINERYMREQLRYFETYKNTQIETKRIRHDMKNHMLCIKELCEQKKYDALQAYVNSLNEITSSIDSNLHIGNDIADAIISEKNAIARENNIMLSIDGSLSGITHITPIDICTIFANALDNAIEACEKVENNRLISISVKRNRNYIVISFCNTIAKTVIIQNNKIHSSKNDNENHGFGLTNIKAAIEKYHGEMMLSCNEKMFTLEIIILV